MLMANEKELSVYATDSTLGQMETNSLDTAGFVWYLQSESIETRVKYPDNSMATVYLSYIFSIYIYYTGVLHCGQYSPLSVSVNLTQLSLFRMLPGFTPGTSGLEIQHPTSKP